MRNHTLPLLLVMLLAPLALLHAAEPVVIDLSQRTWQGIPGLERTAKGRVYVSWFTGGPKEPSPDNTVVLSYSDDAGKTFTPPEAMGLPTNDGTRCFDPTLWIDPKGRLWYIFNRGNKDLPKHDVWARICEAPDAPKPSFGPEFRVGYDAPFTFRMNKVTVLSTGEWIMPVTLAEKPVRDWCTGYNEKQIPTLHGVGISTDEGRTWKLHGAVKSKPWALENMIVELKDGRLWMLIRTNSGVLWQSHSTDKGRTWTEGNPSNIKNPGSRFFIRRLSSGNLLLVNHYKYNNRSHLTALLSTDDGATWNEGLLLDERKGVSYPDGVQDKDGLIWITYDRDRGGAGEILLAKFREEDVIAGKDVSGTVTLKQSVDKLSKPAQPPKLPHDDAPSQRPPQHVGPPRAEHAATNRAFTGIPSMAVAPKGRLWASWYAGVTPGEDLNNYVVLSTSGDNGKTWTEVLTVDPDAGGPVRSFDPELWVSPDGRLYFFWAQMERGRRDAALGVWYIETREPDAESPRWSKPRRIGDGVMMCKPMVLSSGEWALPISKWREHDESAQLIVSDNGGESWTRRGGCNVPKDVRQFDEHMFIERGDGSLWLTVRTNYGIGESVSKDRGKTWPELRPSSILHTPSRFFISRLMSGNLLLVKHGPLDTRTSRSHLTAYISKDDGMTWSGGLMLDERLGISYPDGQQTSDGLIRIIYDYNRVSDRNILMATFREEDVAASKDVSGAVKLRQVVSKATGGQEKPQTSAAPVRTHADGKPLRITQPGSLSIVDGASQPLVPGAKLFTDRAHLAAALPAGLKNARFLPVTMNGQKTIKCERAGTVFFLTPILERNIDTAAQGLMDQGFEKVALPEIPLFNPASPANYCTLFQKDCAAGETILIGKWAVPIFVPAVTRKQAGDKSGKKFLLPADWDPKAEADKVLTGLVKVTAPQVKGAHDAEFVCVGDRAYVVEHDNDVAPGHGAGAAQYCVLSVVSLKTRQLEKTIPMAKSEQAFDNVTLPKGMCFVPRIIRKDEHTLRTYFCSQPAKEQAITWYRDFDLRTLTFEGGIHKAKLQTSAGVFDMEPRHFHADAKAQGFTRKAFNQGLFIFDSFKEFAGRRYVALNNFPGKQNALAVLHDDLMTFEIIGHYNEPQSQDLSESAVNRLPDGSWMAICRNDKGNYHFTTSQDGRTWTIGQPRPFVPNGLNSKPTFEKFGDVYHLGWQENTKVGGCTRSVFNVDVSRDGLTWERKYRFESPHSFQYPSFHEHQGSIWLTVTQSDHKGSSDRIMFGKLEDVSTLAGQAGKAPGPEKK